VRLLFVFVFLITLVWSKKLDTIMVPLLFEGNRVVDTSDLEELVGVEKAPFLAFWEDKRPKVNSVLRRKLDETFKLFYKNEGFYEANISNKFSEDGIKVFIEEKRPIVISEIKVESDLDISNEITLLENSRFRAKDFTQTKKNIRRFLLSKGYCSPDLSTKAYLDLEKYSAFIHVVLKKKNICHFGKITVETNSSTMNNDVILSRLHFKEGDVFDISKIQESYESLYALESFDQLNLDYSRNFYREKPVNINYKEVKKNIHTRIGLGYATDLKFRMKLYTEYKNFRGNGKKILLDGLFSNKQKIIESRFFVPNIFSFDDYYVDFQNSVGYKEEDGIHHFNEIILYDKLYFSHKSSEWYNSLGVGFEKIKTLNSTTKDEVNFLMYPFMRLVYDRRDSKLNPKEGLYFSHEMEYGIPHSSDSTTYLKYIEELHLIYTLNNITFSTVGRIGAIKLFDNNIPKSKKFFAGGAFSNRAYGYDRIGITESTTKNLKTGGFTLANLSVEANFPIYENFGGAIFTDNTMISNNQGIWEFSNKVITSVGIGFRYLTPLGPFKVDMGVNVHNKDENAIHFQVGQSF